LKKKALINALKMLCAAALLFALSYFFNPLNGAMRHSLTGPVSVLVRIISPEVLAACGKFVLVTLFVGLPGLLLGPVFQARPLLKTGIFSGLACSAVAVANFIALEKGGVELRALLVAAPFFAVSYFLLGFISGSFWAFIGKRLF
jgi:hypothetical protein